MTVVKLAISLEAELAKQIRLSAAREPISNWLADAARQKLRFEAMQRALDMYEAEFGKITDEELEETRREMDEGLRAARERWDRMRAQRKLPKPGRKRRSR